MSIIGTIYEDVVTDVLGHMGAWQWMVTFVSTSLMVSAMFNQYEDMFLLNAPSDVICTPAVGHKIDNSSACYSIASNSTEKISCSSWDLRIMGMFWLKKTWIITCGQELKLLSTAMVCRLGFMFGCVIFGLISDSFGRKKAMLIEVVTHLFVNLSIIFSNSEGWFKLLVFLRSLLGSSNSYMGLILVCEIASNSWRSRLSLLVVSPRLFAAVCMVPMARAVSNAETHSFIACIFDVLFLIILWWTPESPQWLLFNNKVSDAERTLYKAALKNGIKLMRDFKIRPVNHSAYYCLEESQTCIGILDTNNIRIIVVVSLVFWNLYFFSWSIIYVTVYTKGYVGYSLARIISFALILGCLTIFISLKWRMRQILMMNVLTTGVCAAIVIYFGTVNEELCGVLSSIAIASGVIAHGILLMISPRIFAINIRATLLGFCHAAGQLGTIVGYLLTVFKPIDMLNLAWVQVGVALLLAALCLVLPDVDNRELPDVLEDMDYFSELTKPLRWATQKTDSPSTEEVEMRVHSFGSHVRPSNSHSDERIPAKGIGFKRLGRELTRCFCGICCYFKKNEL